MQTVTDPLSHSKTFDYDSNGYVNKVTDALGNSTTSIYNALGWMQSTTDALSHTTTYAYDNWGRVTSVTAPDGTVSRTFYDANSNVTCQQDADAVDASVPSGIGWYNGTMSGFGTNLGFTAGNAWIDTGARQQPLIDTSQSYSTSMWIVPGALNGQTHFLLSQNGVNKGAFELLLTSSNALILSTWQSDAAGVGEAWFQTSAIPSGQWDHIVAVTDTSARTMSLYVNNALAGSMTLPTGWTPWKASQHFLIGAGWSGETPYNGSMDDLRIYNRALSASDVSALYSYNPTTTSSTTAPTSGLSHYWNFDENGGGTIYDQCHTTQNYYDADNRLTSSKNGLGDVSVNTYDGTDPRGNGRTQKGLLSSHINGRGYTTYYGYTVRNEPEYTRYPDNTTESVVYDADGNKTSHTDQNGNTIGYVYDPGNRLTNVNYPSTPGANIVSTPNVSFTYDGANRKLTMTDGSMYTGNNGSISTTTWSYDNDSRITQVLDPRCTIGYTYDTASRLTQKLLTVGGSVITYNYTYDNDNRPATEQLVGTAAATQFSYNTDGTLKTKTQVNGMSTSYSYDSAAQVTGITSFDTSSNNIVSTAYSYFPNGSLASRGNAFDVITGNGGFYDTTSYQYDGAGELMMENRADGWGGAYPLSYTYHYGYDHNGNRSYKDFGPGSSGRVDSYSYNSRDEMTAGGQYTFAYNSNGDMTAIYNTGTLNWSYAFDMEDRLRSYQNQQPSIWGTNYYTGTGGRYMASDSTNTGGRWQYNDGDGATASLLADGVKTYNPGLGEYASGSYFDYAEDTLGSVGGLMNSSQRQQEAYLNDAFGLPVSSNGTVTFAQGQIDGFAAASGYQTDNDTGLIRCGNRYYNSFLGRFITADPAGSGDNWYAYCDNDPTDATDPDGLDQQDPPVIGPPTRIIPNPPVTVDLKNAGMYTKSPDRVDGSLMGLFSTIAALRGPQMADIRGFAAGGRGGALGLGLYLASTQIHSQPWANLVSASGGALTSLTVQATAQAIKQRAAVKFAAAAAVKGWKQVFTVGMRMRAGALNLGGDALFHFGTIGLAVSAAQAGWAIGTAIDNIHYGDGQSFQDYYSNAWAQNAPGLANVSIFGH